MDNAIAYRFFTSFPQNVKVLDEPITLIPTQRMTACWQQPNSFKTAYEEPYRSGSVSAIKLSTSPLLLKVDGSDIQLLIAETDVNDYPRMFLKGDPSGRIKSTFPKATLRWTDEGDRGMKIEEQADYIASTNGDRSFPWRYVILTDSKGLLSQTVSEELSPKCEIKDTQWIRPGKVSWEWWNGATPYGPDVHFKAGNNLDTYKYFADFASKYGIDYILLDEGWAKDTRDPYVAKPEMKLKELIDYSRSKGVGIILWLPWLTVEHHPELFAKYEEWGISGVKIDFMDHSDQMMVNFYCRTAKACADHHLVLDMHGSFTPAGLEYRYPNLLSYEGVRGMEQMAGCTPDNSLFLPFIRNAVGPMDFTPGAMLNYQPDKYFCNRPNSGAIGTRAYQMALYGVFNSGLQMLADNPTLYYHNDDCARMIASTPVTWDATVPIQAEAGKFAVVAKRKGNKWFLAAINNGDGGRTFTFALSFLAKGRKYRMTAFRDGLNADYQAMDYDKDTFNVDSKSSLTIQMVKNGGFMAVIE